MAAKPVLVTEAEGWEAAVWTHARMLYRIAYAVLRHHQDAEDAVQETLQRAWKYRHRFAEVDDPAAWLARIAWRVAKARRPRPGAVSLDQVEAIAQLRAAGASAEELAAHRQMKALADQLIQHLPAKLRQPLVLSTVEELSAREIGHVLGIPEASVRTRCLRARRLLREKLGAALRGGCAALPAGKIGAKGREPGSPEPASGSGVVVIPQGDTPPGNECGAAPARRSADLGPPGPQVGASTPPRAVTAGRLTSGTRAAGALGPAPTKEVNHGSRS